MASAVVRLGALTNVVHGFIYFAPEAVAEYDQLGLKGRQQYFASRAAPMGPVGPELVVATFFNFNPTSVASALPSAWAVASPAQIQAARFRAAEQVLQQLEVDDAELAAATEIAARMASGIGYEGKALAAANRAVELPAAPLLRFWQLITTIREWRGDAHVAVLNAAPVTALEALVLHAATGQVPAGVLKASRAWSDEDWQVGINSLHARGLMDLHGVFTPKGQAFRDQIEADTNRAAEPLVDAVGDDDAHRLCDLLKPVRKGLLESGVFNAGLPGLQ